MQVCEVFEMICFFPDTFPLHRRQLVTVVRGRCVNFGDGNQPPLIINHQPSIINHQSSIINHQSSIINHQPSIINHQSSIINHHYDFFPYFEKIFHCCIKDVRSFLIVLFEHIVFKAIVAPEFFWGRSVHVAVEID